MSTPQKPKQSASRWNFLSQAVASVESGLDRILAEEDEPTKKLKPQSIKPLENGSSSRTSLDVSQTDPSTKPNDRLQARLAQAMVNKGGSRATTPVPVSESVSRAETPDLGDMPQNLEDADLGPEDVSTTLNETTRVPSDSKEMDISTSNGSVPPTGNPEARLSLTTDHSSKDVVQTQIPRISADSKPSTDDQRPSTESGVVVQPVDPDAASLNAQIDHEKSLSSLQDEINGYLERIDALHRNLQILTHETIARTRDIKNASDSMPMDKQLAEKDEKIALLIEEGTKLTKGEMQYRNVIKKLRLQVVTSNKDQEAVRARAEKAEKSVSSTELRARKAESESRQNREQLNALTKSSSDVTLITKERNALQSSLADVRNELSRANKRAEEAESQAQSDKLEAERLNNIRLTDDLTSVKLEKELSEDKLKREIAGLRQSLIGEKELTRQMETEMLAEQAALESKLESFRLRVEEASTNDEGDSQAKLLRQIDTLQAQYSTASSNWQGIESTLLSRITALEKERDEVVGREADLRRKLRDMTNKAKLASKDLEETQQALNALQDKEDAEVIDARRATNRADQLEGELMNLRKEMEDRKLQSEKDFNKRLEEEKTKWLTSLPATIPKMDSPVASMRKAPASSYMDSLMSPIERPSSRRSSTQPFHDLTVHSRFNSSASLRPNGTIPETPSIHTPDDQDDFFANVPFTPASATHADSNGRNAHDLISASTAGAGPSVQLVERLSTNVRRLESEKAAAKDEMARLSTQRDEARKEVVNLMREAEQKRMADDRLAKLDKQHKDLTSKYEATLELLGEKTEQVDELKADVADVKQMYRHLADTMGR